MLRTDIKRLVATIPITASDNALQQDPCHFTRNTIAVPMINVPSEPPKRSLGTLER